MFIIVLDNPDKLLTLTRNQFKVSVQVYVFPFTHVILHIYQSVVSIIGVFSRR